MISDDAKAHLVVLCTCPDPDVAARIARATVEAGVAACANRIDGVASLFRWKGGVQEETESLLLLKYEVPEIIALPIVIGDAPYLNWIDDNLS